MSFATFALISILAAASAPSAAAAEPQATAPASVHVAVRAVSPEARKPVSFESVSGLMVFKAVVAGKEVWALLDTGAERSIMGMAFAREAGLKTTRRDSKVNALNGAVDSWLVDPVPVVIPGQIELTTPAIGIDLTTVSKFMGRRIDWIVGAEFFSSATLMVDPGRRTFQLAPSGAVKPPAAMPSIPVLEGMKVELMVNGKPVTVAIDTGSNEALALTPQAWARVGSRDAKMEMVSTVGADGVPHIVDVARADVAMGPVKRPDTAISITPGFAKNGDGIVGMGLLGSLLLVLDAGGGKLWFAPRVSSSVSSAPTPPPVSQ